MTDKKGITVSIVIPAYNEAESIAACLESCVDQTELPDEILVIDNNSDDGTKEVIQRYVQEYPRLVTYVHQPVQGLIPARNLGLDMAKGEVLGRIDADSRLEPSWVANLKAVFADPLIMAATGPSTFYDTPKFSRKLGTYVHTLVTHKVNQRIAGHKMLWGSNMALRRSAWAKIREHACNEKDLLEDLDLAIHCHEAGLDIAFDDSLINGVSPRRFQASPKSISAYFGMWPWTYEKHGNVKAAKVTRFIIPVVFSGMYIPTNVILRGYNPKTRLFSLRKFINHAAEERGNP